MRALCWLRYVLSWTLTWQPTDGHDWQVIETHHDLLTARQHRTFALRCRSCGKEHRP